MAFTFDSTKPVKTRDGHKARIICTDARGELPVIALIGATEEIYRYYAGGKYYPDDEHKLDLVNVPAKQEGWVNVYPGRTLGWPHHTKAEADEDADRGRIACVHIEWEEPA